MFGLRSLRSSEHERPFWLLAALAVVMLAGVSTTIAHAASAPALVDGLQRDLGAVRAQLERLDAGARASSGEAGQQAIAFNTDLGDGGTAFRYRSMATILRSAHRRLENLIAGYDRAGDERRLEIAHSAQLDLRDLSRRLHRLDRATDPTSAVWAHERVEAEALLDQLQDMLAELTRARSGLG